jgi:hypothetical protein
LGLINRKPSWPDVEPSQGNKKINLDFLQTRFIKIFGKLAGWHAHLQMQTDVEPTPKS